MAIIVVSGAFMYLNHFQSNGTVDVYVHDSANSNVSAVYITFMGVSLHSNNTGWTNYTVGKMTVNILDLTTTNASFLKSITLHPERYTMIRLYIQNVTVVVDGNSYNFTMADQYALINHPFVVSPHSVTNVSIDFNLKQDLNLNARMFTPYVGVAIS